MSFVLVQSVLAQFLWQGGTDMDTSIATVAYASAQTAGNCNVACLQAYPIDDSDVSYCLTVDSAGNGRGATTLAGTATVLFDSATIVFSVPQTLPNGAALEFANQPGNFYFLQGEITSSTSATMTGAYTGTGGPTTATQLATYTAPAGSNLGGSTTLPTNVGQGVLAIAYAYNIVSAATNPVTAVLSNDNCGSDYSYLSISEFSGVLATSDPYDTSGNNFSNSNVIPSLTLTAGAAGDLVIVSATEPTPDCPNISGVLATQLTPGLDSPAGVSSQYGTSGSAGSVPIGGGTWIAQDGWAMVAMALKAAGTAPPTSVLFCSMNE